MTIDTQHPLSGLHINQGSIDAAADAYEGEYLRAKIRAALAQQPSDDIPYPFLPDSLIIATRHQSGTTTYRAEMRDEQDRLTIGGSWHPTRQAATAEAWAIKCDLMRAQQPSAQDREDAERWRYMRRKLCLTGNGDGTCAMQAINLPVAIPVWPEPGRVAEFCDTAIDAAIANDRAAAKGK